MLLYRIWAGLSRSTYIPLFLPMLTLGAAIISCILTRESVQDVERCFLNRTDEVPVLKHGGSASDGLG